MTFPFRSRPVFNEGLQMPSGAAADKVIMSDASGNGSWQTAKAVPYATLVANHGASNYWPLQSNFTDVIGAANGTGGNVVAGDDSSGPMGDSGTTFNGTTSRIALPTTVGNGRAWYTTLEAWIKVNPTVRGTIFKVGGDTTGWGLFCGDTTSGDTLGEYVDGLFETRQWILPNAPGNRLHTGSGANLHWYHVALLIGGANRVHNIVVDGIPNPLITTTDPVAVAGSGGIGAYIVSGSAGRFFTGSIAHVALYPRLLSTAEIVSHAGHPTRIR